MNKVFIVDIYDNAPNIRSTFRVGNKKLCIKEVDIEWGLPVLPIKIADDAPEPSDFRIYETYEEAKNYIDKLIKINRGL